MAPELPAASIRPMDFGELLDTSVRLLKTRWNPLVLLGMLNAIPGVIYSIVAQSLLPKTVPFNSPLSNPYFYAWFGRDPSEILGIMGALAGVGILVGLVTIWLHGALLVAASRTYLGQPVTVWSALKSAGRRYPALLGTSLLMLLFGILAVPALILAGLLFLAFLTIPIGLIILFVYSAFTSQALVLEETGGGMPSIRRSFSLVNGRFWPLLGLGILFAFFSGVLNGQITLITQLPIQLITTVRSNPALASVLTWVLTIILGLLSAVMAPLRSVALTLAYYDTRMRKEGFDIELMVAQQGVR